MKRTWWTGIVVIASLAGLAEITSEAFGRNGSGGEPSPKPTSRQLPRQGSVPTA